MFQREYELDPFIWVHALCSKGHHTALLRCITQHSKFSDFNKHFYCFQVYGWAVQFCSRPSSLVPLWSSLGWLVTLLLLAGLAHIFVGWPPVDWSGWPLLGQLSFLLILCPPGGFPRFVFVTAAGVWRRTQKWTELLRAGTLFFLLHTSHKPKSRMGERHATFWYDELQIHRAKRVNGHGKRWRIRIIFKHSTVAIYMSHRCARLRISSSELEKYIYI